MVPNILPACPLRPWVRVKRSTFHFQNMVMLHIKLKGITKLSNMVANNLPAVPPPQWPWGMRRSKGQNSFFSEYGHIAYQNKLNQEMKQHSCKYFARRTPLPLPLRVKSQNPTFSVHGHVAYQIKGNHECSNIVANILPAPRPTLGMGSIGATVAVFLSIRLSICFGCSKEPSHWDGSLDYNGTIISTRPVF